MTRPAGRPKVDPEDYNPNWEEEMMAGYADGNSDIWVRVHCFKKHIISSDLWYRWIDELAGFSAAVKQGKTASQAFWETEGKKHATGENTDANATSLIFQTCNRFPDAWKQRQSVEQTTKVSLGIDEIDKLKDILEENGVDIENL